MPLRESAAVVDKEVGADSSAMAEAADQALADWADRDRRQRFEDWGTYLAHDKAVQALAQTLTALQQQPGRRCVRGRRPALRRDGLDRPRRR